MEEYQCQNHTGHVSQIKNLEAACLEMQYNQRLLVQSSSDLKERTIAVEASAKSAHHRVDSMEKLTDAIMNLAVEVKEVSKDTKMILDRMERHEQKTEMHENRIEKLEDAPGTIAIKGWMFAGGIVGTAIIAFFMGKVGL